MRGVVTVTLLTPVYGDEGPLGNRSITWEPEEVAGVLFAPGDASSMPADRPEGAAADATFHFPKAYSALRDRPMRGCRIEYGGRTWRVIGDPVPYPAALVPGPWNFPVEAEATHG